MVLSQINENGKRCPAHYGSIILKDQETRYSQPKLELYGLFRALREWPIYLIGAKKLQVEVDAKYIKGMMEQPDLMPKNRWIQEMTLSLCMYQPQGSKLLTDYHNEGQLKRKLKKQDQQIMMIHGWMT